MEVEMKLREIAEISVTIPFMEQDEGQSMPVLKVSNLVKGYKITPIQEIKISADRMPCFVSKGDILVKRINPDGAYLYDNDDNPVLGTNLIKISLFDMFKEKFSQLFLCFYITSKLEKVASFERTLPNVETRALRELEIPDMDFYPQETLGEAWFESLTLKDLKVELAEKEAECIFKELVNITDKKAGGDL